MILTTSLPNHIVTEELSEAMAECGELDLAYPLIAVLRALHTMSEPAHPFRLDGRQVEIMLTLIEQEATALLDRE